VKPWDAARPTVKGSSVPWRAIGPPSTQFVSTSECAEVPSAATPNGPFDSESRKRSLTKYRPTGVGVCGVPIATRARKTGLPERNTTRRFDESVTTMRSETGYARTASAAIQPVLPLGLTGSCTRYHVGLHLA